MENNPSYTIHDATASKMPKNCGLLEDSKIDLITKIANYVFKIGSVLFLAFLFLWALLGFINSLKLFNEYESLFKALEYAREEYYLSLIWLILCYFCYNAIFIANLVISLIYFIIGTVSMGKSFYYHKDANILKYAIIPFAISLVCHTVAYGIFPYAIKNISMVDYISNQATYNILSRLGIIAFILSFAYMVFMEVITKKYSLKKIITKNILVFLSVLFSYLALVFIAFGGSYFFVVFTESISFSDSDIGNIVVFFFYISFILPLIAILAICLIKNLKYMVYNEEKEAKAHILYSSLCFGLSLLSITLAYIFVSYIVTNGNPVSYKSFDKVKQILANPRFSIYMIGFYFITQIVFSILGKKYLYDELPYNLLLSPLNEDNMEKIER